MSGLAPSRGLAPSSITENAPVITGERGRVRVTVTGADGNLVTINRRHPSGRIVTVRGMNLTDLSGGAFIGWDYEAPIGIDLAYTATTYIDPDTPLATSTAADITWTTDAEWLKDPLEPIRNIPIRIQGMPTLDYATPTGVHAVLGRPDPITVSQIRSAATGTISIVTLTQDETDALHYITASGHVLLLQSEYAVTGIGNLYLAPLDLSEARVVDLRDEQARVWQLSFQEVTSPVGDSSPFTNWQDVIDTYSTWQDVVDANTSWLQMIENLNSVSQPSIVTWRGN